MHLKSLILKGFKSFADRSRDFARTGHHGNRRSERFGKIEYLRLRAVGAWRAQCKEFAWPGHGRRHFCGLFGPARRALAWPKSNSCSTTPTARCPSISTRYRLLAACTVPAKANISSMARPPAAWTSWTSCMTPVLARARSSIISQGKLDAILASKPEDRRTLIEEAAGVLKHKQRKERSERKLASMDASLARVKDVTAEVERQLKPLARKAQRAKQYQGLADELARLDLVLAVDDLRTLQGKWNATLKSENEAAAGIDVQKIKAQKAEEELEALQLALQEKGLYVGDLTAQRGRFHMVVERFESADMLLSEKARSIRSRREQAENTAMGSARRISNYEEEVAALQEQLEERTARRDALATQVEELKAQFDEAKAERQSRDIELAEVQRSLRQREREIDEKTAKRARLQDALSGRVSTKQLLESKRDEIDAELESATVELDEKCKGLDEETAALAELLEKSRAATEDVTAAERAVAMATSTLDDKRKAAQRLEGKIAALEEINRGMLEKRCVGMGCRAWRGI